MVSMGGKPGHALQTPADVEMTPLQRAAVIGAVLAVGLFTWGAGMSLEALLDPFIWLLLAFIALVGAFASVSVLLAWQQVRASPRWLLATLAGLLLLSVPPLSSFVREARETQRLLAAAESTKGVVADKYVRGAIHLIVEYEVAGRTHRIRKVGAKPYFGTPAFTEWKRGDSLPVYYMKATPDVALVGNPGPSRRALAESLAKLWLVCGVLMTAYLPPAIRWIRRRSAPAGARVQQAPT